MPAVEIHAPAWARLGIPHATIRLGPAQQAGM